LMPGLSGFDTLAVLKNDPQTADIPVMFLTIVEGRERGLKLGAAAYLNKPIDSQDLVRTIRHILGGVQSGESREALVLSVDEEACNQILAELQRVGLQPRVFDSLSALVEHTAQHAPRLIVLDGQTIAVDAEAAVRELQQVLGKTHATVLILARGSAAAEALRQPGVEQVSDLDELSRRLRDDAHE